MGEELEAEVSAPRAVCAAPPPATAHRGRAPGRWFVLRSPHLLYFLDPLSSDKKGSVNLSNLSNVQILSPAQASVRGWPRAPRPR